MTVKELIEELQKANQSDKVFVHVTYTYHTCGDEPCYCSDVDELRELEGIDIVNDGRPFGGTKRDKGFVLHSNRW